MQVLGLAARAMADSRMSLEARLKSKFNLQQTGGAADVVVASAAAGLVDDPYAFPDVDVCRAPVPTGRLPGPVTPHPTPIARLYPELAEKLERARSQPVEPRGVGTAAPPPPPAASCAPGARAGGPVGAREDGRTMARLQTKIAQNKLKERLKQRGRELKGASRPAGKGAGDRWAGYGAVQRPFGDTNGAASPTRLLSANRADVLYSPPGVFGAGTPLGTDTPLGAGTTPLGVVTPLGAAGTDVGTGSAFSALFAGLERPLPLGLSPAPSAPSACVTRVAFPDSWTEIGAASRLPHAPCATAKPAERKWRKADARSRPAGRRARDPSAETGRKAARRGAASSRAGSRKAGAAGTASGRPRPRGRKSADPVVVEPRTPVIEDVAGPPAGPTPLWPPVGEAWMACGDDPRLTVGELQPPTAAAVVAAAAASPMRGDVPLRSPHSAAASRVPPCAARGADETPPAPPYTCLRTRCPPVPDAAAAAEARVKSRLRHRSALLMYESFLKQTVVDVNLLPVGADSSNDDDSDLDDTLPWQQEWVLTSSEEDNDDDDLDTGIPSAIRLTKVSLLRSKLRRQLLQLRRCRHANGALRRRQQVALRAALRASRCCPAEATAVVVALTASRGDTARGRPHMHRSDDGGGSSQTCLHRGAEEEEVCGRTALPFANHCLRHIMYNVDQQIFDLCTAKFADNTQCCVPAFDLRHELPLCAEHAAKADNYQRSHGTRPKKPRKKTKPSALTRPPKKGKKKRNMKKAVLAQIPSPPPRPPADVTDEPHFSVDVEVSSPRRQNSNDLQNDLENDLDEDILDNSLDNDDLDDSFSPGVMEKNLEFDTGTELLDEHDLHDVLNRLPEAFDLFNGRTGFVPSREDAEALERALAQVSQELCDANESLALLDHTGAPPDADELTKLLDGEQLSAAAAALDENLSALASSITATDLHNLSQVLTNSELTRALEGGPRPSDVRHCDVRPCDVRPCDIRPYDVRPYDIRLCDVRPCDVRSGDIRPCDVRPCDVRPCDIRPSIVCPSDTRLCDIRPSIDLSSDVRPSILPSDVRPSILLSSDVRPSIILPSDLRPSMLLPSDVRPSIIISSDVRPSVFVPSDVRPSVFVSSDVRPSVFVPSDVRPSVFVPSDVRPSITIPSDVRPSVFVPSDVRPSVFVPSDMQPSEMRCCDVRPPGPPGGARPCLPVLQAQLARRPFHEPLLLSPAALRFPPPPGGRARTDAVAAASWRVAPPGVNGLPPMSCAFRLAAPLPPPPAALSPAKLPPLHALLPAAGDAATNTLLLPPSVTLHPPFSLPYALPLPGNGAQQRRPYPDT